MRLRLRLILSFLCLATALGVVGFVSVRENRAIENEVEGLLYSSIDEAHEAIALASALQHLEGAAHHLLAAVAKARLGRDGVTAAVPRAAEVGFLARIEEAEHHLEKSRQATESGLALAQAQGDERRIASEQEELTLWIEPMDIALQALGQHAQDFVQLTRQDVEQAERFHRMVFTPQLEEKLLPLVERYHDDAQEEMVQAAQLIAAETATATRVIAIVSAAALVLALILALTIGRAVVKPIEALRTAAVRVGRGELGTRVEPRARDELGELTVAFNQMVEEVGRTTITKSYLDNVIHTMTGALIIVDPARRIRRVNRATLDLLSYEEAALHGQLLDLICPDRDPINTGSLVRLSDDGHVRNLDRNFVRRDGTVVPVSFSGSTLRDAEGNIQEFVCVAYDISERKRMEERLRASLQEKELLLREVHHRVKNNLQVISSLLDLQSDFIRDPQHLAYVNDSRNRIRSMALIHEQLYRTDDLAAIHLQTYLEKLSAHLFGSFGIEPGRIALRLWVEEVPLHLDHAIACGLILNELVSNSLKHAFPDGAGGAVKITFSAPTADTYRLEVADDGTGLDAACDLRNAHSMGLTLVTAMVKQLRGTLVVRNERGTAFRIDFPRPVAPELPRSPEEKPWPTKPS